MTWSDYEKLRTSWLRSLDEERRAERRRMVFDVCVVVAAVVAIVRIIF